MNNHLKVALIGNPNVGKTTLHNRLCKQQSKTANWSGVTLQKKVSKNHKITWIDLPGCYSLHNFHNKSQPDYQDIRSVIESDDIDFYLQILTSTQLPRQLYLTLQLLEIGKPLILVVNHFDKIASTAESLQSIFNIPVIDINALKLSSPENLLQLIHEQARSSNTFFTFHKHLPKSQQDNLKQYGSSRHLLEQFEKLEAKETYELELAEARYQFINHQTLPKFDHISKLDRWLIHHPLSWVVFIVSILSIFSFASTFNEVIEPPITIIAETFFMHGTYSFMTYLDIPIFIKTLAVYGFGQGVTTILSLLPIIFSMFLGLFFLEESGYLARVSVLLDRQLKFLGLPGSASISLFLGFGCNVGAILSTRHMKNKHQRIIAIAMIPFMSCSARLSIFAVFCALLFSSYSALIITLLYMTGLLVAFLTAFALSKFLDLPARSSMTIDLIPMRWPKLGVILKKSIDKTWGFIRDAGYLIILFCFILALCNNIDLNGKMIESTEQVSVLAHVGKPLTKLFKPIGIQNDNWPAAAALFTGLLAKEVVIGTLTTLYAQAHLIHLDLALEPFAPTEQLLNAWLVFKSNCYSLISSGQTDTFIEPIIQHHLPEHFTDSVATFSYLIFILLYFPCISTYAIIRSEIGKKWAYLSISWSLVIAYCVAAGIFQSYQHPEILLAVILICVAYKITLTLRQDYASLN